MSGNLFWEILVTKMPVQLSVFIQGEGFKSCENYTIQLSTKY